MRSAIASTLLLFSTPSMAAAVFTPVHVAPVVHVAPTVRVNPGVHGHSVIKPGTKGDRAGRHSQPVTVVTDTSTPREKCADKQSGKDCLKR